MKKIWYLKHPVRLVEMISRFIGSKFKKCPNKDVAIKFDDQYIIGNPAQGSVNYRIWSMGMTEFLPTQLVKDSLHKDMVFIDIGANQGYFTFLAAKRVMKVLAFEPVPSACERLEAGISANGYTNIELHRVALGNDNKDVTMNIETFQVSNGKDGSLKVQLRRLDDYCAEMNFKRVDFIKIDVEGEEFNALLGMRQVLSQFRPNLMIEVHPKFLKQRNQDVKMIIDYLNELSFQLSPLDIPRKAYNEIVAKNAHDTFHLIATQ